MPEERELEKQLKLISKTGKFIVGRREVASGLKGSKLLVWSASANLPQTILDESRNLSIPAVRFNGNPVELGRACGIPFRVSVIAVKSPGDADIRTFSSAADYVASSPSMITLTEGASTEAKEEEVEEELKTPAGAEASVKSKRKKGSATKESEEEEQQPQQKEAPAKTTRKSSSKKSKKEPEETEAEKAPTAEKEKSKKTKKSASKKSDEDGEEEE